MSGITHQQWWRLAACWGLGPALGRGALCGSETGEGGQLPGRWGKDWRAVMMCGRECPPAMARPAVRGGGGAASRRGSIIDALASGRES